jgi:hypothetical protein
LIIKFLEDVEPSGSVYSQRFYLEETRELTEGLSYEGCLIELMENQIDYLELQSIFELPTHEENVQYESTQTLQNAKEVELRVSYRIRKSAIPSNYVAYLKSLILISNVRMIQIVFTSHE